MVLPFAKYKLATFHCRTDPEILTSSNGLQLVLGWSWSNSPMSSCRQLKTFYLLIGAETKSGALSLMWQSTSRNNNNNQSSFALKGVGWQVHDFQIPYVLWTFDAEHITCLKLMKLGLWTYHCLLPAKFLDWESGRSFHPMLEYQ